jgi:hypothetical protein
MTRVPIPITIPADQWEPAGPDEDPLASLAGPNLVINGLSMHLEAWAVVNDDEKFTQDPVVADDEYNLLHAAVHADGSFNTVRIGGRDYILVASPFC